MILTDSDVISILLQNRNIHNETNIIISPFEERALSPVGYDLRVGCRYQFLHEGIEHPLFEGHTIEIPPGETVNIRTLEWLALPRDGSVAGLICSRVMLVAAGASHISTTVDPDWAGHLLISFTNLSRTKLSISYGERFCTLVFIANKSPAHKLSQHAPGRPDALNQNASRIALEYRNKKRRSIRRFAMMWIFVGAIYAAILFATHLIFGQNNIFVAVVAAGVVLVGFLNHIVGSPFVGRTERE